MTAEVLQGPEASCRTRREGPGVPASASVADDVGTGTTKPSLRATIVCCAKNGEKHLPQLWSCLRNVADPRVEILLVDDASVDRTGSVFEEWARVLPNTRVQRRSRSLGAGAAKDDAVAAARGEYVWIIDCDDRFPADGLTMMLEAAERADADVVVAQARAVTPGGQLLSRVDGRHGSGLVTGAQAFERLLDGRIEGYTWSKLFRGRLFEEGGFVDDAAPPRLTTQEDLCRTATALARSGRVVLLESDVYCYVRHGSSLMDRAVPPLDNFQAAHDHVVRLARRVLPPGRGTRRRVALFTVRELMTSVLKVPIYVDAGRGVRASGRRIARRAVREISLADVVALDRRRGFEALLIRIHPLLYTILFAGRQKMGQWG